MAERPKYLCGIQDTNSNSFFKWKGINISKKKHEEKGLWVPRFLQENGRKIEQAVVGPGGGAGIGCGVGVGLGLVGGVGYGGWPWSHLRMVFGIGMGCGIGVGFGYGSGIGLGFTLNSILNSMNSSVSRQNAHSNDWIVIQI